MSGRKRNTRRTAYKRNGPPKNYFPSRATDRVTVTVTPKRKEAVEEYDINSNRKVMKVSGPIQLVTFKKRRLNSNKFPITIDCKCDDHEAQTQLKQIPKWLQGRHQKSASMSQLYIRSESFEGSKVISFNRNQTIKHIKLQIRDKTGIPVDKQRVFLKWKILKDDCLITDYNIQNGDTLLVKVDSPWSGPLRIHTPSPPKRLPTPQYLQVTT
eukprot:607865_1